MAQEHRAIRYHDYGASDKLVLETLPRPQPKEGEVLVEVHFAGVNPVDWKIRSGIYKAFMPASFPVTPGIDFSGVVAELGSAVTGFKKGDEVFGIAKGSYAEYAIAAAADVAHKPKGLSMEQAASLPVTALTAWKIVEDAAVQAGQTVVIQGAAGGVGHFALQFAKRKGATVVGVASGDNLPFVKSLGADRVVDYKKGSLGAEIKDADVVIDTVGGESLEKSYDLVKRGGTLVTVAGQVSEEKAKAKGIKAIGSGRAGPEHLKEIAELLEKKILRVEISKVFALREAGAAQDLSQTGHGRGRILLKIKQ